MVIRKAKTSGICDRACMEKNNTKTKTGIRGRLEEKKTHEEAEEVEEEEMTK